VFLKIYIFDTLFRTTMKKNIKRVIAECGLLIAKGKLKIAELGRNKNADCRFKLPIADSPMPPNTLTTFPHYLKKPIRFWNTNVGHEIRSSFDVELYERVCEARGVESGVGMEY
jgi:hypothetical protein